MQGSDLPPAVHTPAVHGGHGSMLLAAPRRGLPGSSPEGPALERGRIAGKPLEVCEGARGLTEPRADEALAAVAARVRGMVAMLLRVIRKEVDTVRTRGASTIERVVARLPPGLRVRPRVPHVRPWGELRRVDRAVPLE
eukprot:12839094-Alexandrium_andersonii.AAC.1